MERHWVSITFKKLEKVWAKLNILYVPYNTKQIRPAYISKDNHKCDNQVILLMITDDKNKNWHYLTVKSISAL